MRFNSMAADLQRQRGELERTNRLEAWADMARQVAHDIKNPLTPIQLSAEHLVRVHHDRGEPLSPVLQTCVTTILSQVRLLRQISSEFSSFATSPVARLAPAQINDVVTEVVEPYRAAAPPGVTIETVLAPALPVVALDRTLLARALVNVIENALHAMPSGGRLTLTTGAEDHALRVAVADSGVGMDDDARARLFEPTSPRAPPAPASGSRFRETQRGVEQRHHRGRERARRGHDRVAAIPDRGTVIARRGTPLVLSTVPGSEFWVPGWVPGSGFVPSSLFTGSGSKCRVRNIAVAPIEPATNLELGTKEPGTVEPPGNLERTRNEEPNLEPRTRNRNRTQSSDDTEVKTQVSESRLASQEAERR